jgi:hypothetical protein
MLEVEVPGGARDITLQHRPGAAEGVGVLLSILSVTALLTGAVRGIVNRATSPQDRA